MAVYANRRFLFTVVILIGTSVQIIGLVNGRPDTALASTKNVYQEDARLSGAAYDTWVFGDSMPIDSVKGQKPQRARRSIHKEKVPGYLVTSSSPYSSIVYISVGCIGTLVSPIHVLTAAHCIHDGVKIRKGPMMYRLKIGKVFCNLTMFFIPSLIYGQLFKTRLLPFVELPLNDIDLSYFVSLSSYLS